jgi:hypothetical protein
MAMTLDELYEQLRTRKDLQLEVGRLEEQKATQERQIKEIDERLEMLYKRMQLIEAKVQK